MHSVMYFILVLLTSNSCYTLTPFIFLLQNVAVFLPKLTGQQPSEEDSKPNIAAERNSAFFFFSDRAKKPNHLHASYHVGHEKCILLAGIVHAFLNPWIVYRQVVQSFLF